MPKMKWEIKGLTPNIKLKNTARKVLLNRIRELEFEIKEYLTEKTPERLHSIRIAVRRLRYNMELFVSCFRRKKFLIFYKATSNLQDITGKIRDTDVLLDNLNSLDLKAASKFRVNASKKIESDNIKLRRELDISLKDYLRSKELKDFIKMLK